ncbi:MAG: peptidylprolyl isomerase [Cytophagales bacterium]|nr:MAG: peptidylprolyl isomerase [Cytophagales bacterium]
MAIISKIREKGWVAAVVIGVSIGLFVIQDMFSANSWIMQSFNKPVAGVIDGTDISLQEYTAELSTLVDKYAAQIGRRPNENEMEYIRNEAFNNLVYKLVMQKEFDKVGVAVTNEEVTDMVQGNNIHPGWAQSFTNPQTGQLDKNMILNFLKNIGQAEPQQQAQFYTFEASLAPERSKEKYNKLFDLSTYVTKKEAESYYKEQNERLNLKYVAIPFFLVQDSTIKVSDDELKSYFDSHKDKYKNTENRAIEYVPFSFNPSSIDSATIKKSLEDLVQQFATTTDDEAFSNANSDVNKNVGTVKPSDLPKDLLAVTLEQGKVYGPFLDREKGIYALHKFIATEQDTVYSMRASHILLDTTGKTAAQKAEIKTKADGVLNQLKGGQNFEIFAGMYGEDGTKDKGGDLGWFTQKQMVAPFEQAVMAASQEGLIPNLVATQFGYHVIKVTGVKNKTKYKLATIIKEIAPSDATREKAFRDASSFATAKDIKEYVDRVGAAKLISLQALNIAKDARFINNITGGKVREIVRWAYNDAKLGQVSPIFELEETRQYIVAVLRGAVEKGNAGWQDVKEELTVEVRKEKKAKEIMDKLAKVANADLEAIAAAYGTSVSVTTMPDVTLQTPSLNGVGYAPVAVGKAFGLKKGQKSGLFKDENAIMAMEVVEITPAAEVADYNSYKEQIVGKRNSQTAEKVLKALKKITKTESDLAKYY